MIRKFINIGLFIVLIGLLLARLQVAIVRYFDPDEFAHMHWAYLLTIGKLQFSDFFFYVLPIYQFFMMPIFFLRASANVVIAARIWQYMLYAANAILVFRIAQKGFNNKHIGLLAAVIFAAFPMTFDKTIDIRPDMLMVFFYLVSVDIILTTNKWNVKRALSFGACLAVSGLTLPKIVFAVPAVAFLLFVRKNKPTLIHLLWIATGAAIPVIGMLGFLTVNGLTQQAVLSILKDSVAVNQGKIPFSPWKALSPWPLVYVESAGPSWPWYVNTAIWLTSGAGLLITLVKKPTFGMFHVLFFGVGIAFLFLFPAPYLQYFLPLSVFGSILAAAAISFIYDLFRKATGNANVAGFLYICIIASIIYALLTSFNIQYQIRVREGNTNTEQTTVITDLLRISKPEEPVYDMVGSYVFRPDAYYYCCHPYGEFADNATIKIPPLRNLLVSTNTRYIILDRTGMSLWQTPSADLAFIKSHYQPSKYLKIYTPGVKFTCVNASCYQLDVEGNKLYMNSANVFQIVIPDVYTVSTIPIGRIVKINDRSYANGSVELPKGIYDFKVDPDVTGFSVQLDR